jgi:energy-coupling factor transporter ATP-binding protein EcfA2
MPDFHQQLVTGHRGCGKSTELLRLKAQLESEKIFTIYLDVGIMLDLGEINYLDILLGIARAIEEQLRENDFKLNQELLEELSNWFAEKVLIQETKDNRESRAKAEAKIGSQIPFLGQLWESLKN